MIGTLGCRFLTHRPALSAVYLAKYPRNSFAERNLPVSLTLAVICEQIPPNPMKTRNLGGRGRGYPKSDISQIGKLFHEAQELAMPPDSLIYLIP